jgi:hypothetical protein
MPVLYDPARPDWSAVRRIFFDWLRSDPNANQLSPMGDVYQRFVEYANNNRQPQVLAFHVTEVFWQLLIEGIVAPGMNSSNQNLPWFHVTEYGKKVLAEEAGHPHDEAGYLARVRARVPEPDPTVLAYLVAALTTFRRGTPVASTVMLGIAAERVFLMVCDSLLAALRDPGEQAALGGILQRFPMKPFLRTQRNDLGHPRDLPPDVDREDAFANLQMFPRYYQIAEELRRFLAANHV